MDNTKKGVIQRCIYRLGKASFISKIIVWSFLLAFWAWTIRTLYNGDAMGFVGVVGAMVFVFGPFVGLVAHSKGKQDLEKTVAKIVDGKEKKVGFK